MKDQLPKRGDSSTMKSTGCFPVVLRTIWMAWGNVALLFSAVKMAEREASTLDTVVFLAVAAGLLGVRYVDIVCFAGETAEGDPASLAHWRQYAAGVVVVSALLWGLAVLVAGHGGI